MIQLYKKAMKDRIYKIDKIRDLRRGLLWPGAPVDGNGTAQERLNPAVNKTCSLHQVPDSALARIVFDRFSDIAIDVRVSVEQPAQRGSCHA